MEENDWRTTIVDEEEGHPHDQQEQEQQQRPQLDSFRLVNTHDISNLRSNLPLNKLLEVFAGLMKRTTTTTRKSSSTTTATTTSTGIRELYMKMSLQTEPFQRLLHHAVKDGLFSQVTVQGDYRSVAMEPTTLEHILVEQQQQQPSQEKNHRFCHAMDKLSLVCMSLNADVMTILGEHLQYAGGSRKETNRGDHHQEQPKHPRRLRSLRLHRTDMENVNALAKGLACNDTLEELSITNTRLVDEQVCEIVRALLDRLNGRQQQAAALTKLSLEGNFCGPRTLEALSEYLAHPTCRLTQLDLCHQLSEQPMGALLPLPPILRDSLHLLGDGISKNSSLKSLNLAGNWLDTADVGKLWKSAQTKTNLASINLSYNRIESVAEFVDSESDNETPSSVSLKRLDLTGNPIWRIREEFDGAVFQREQKAVWRLVDSHPHLEYLGTGLTPDSLSLIDNEDDAGAGPSPFLFTAHLQHALNMNRAGRCLWQCRHERTTSRVAVESLLPLVLERSQRLFDDDDSIGQKAASSSVMFSTLQEILCQHSVGRL